MAFNGSGTFNRLYSWVQDKNNNINISSTEMDAEDNGFATGLSTCLTKDGQQVPTANLPMGGFVHTGVGNATARTHYAVAGQIQDSSLTWCGTAGGTGNAITLTPAPAITTYTAGQRFQFVASAANTAATTVAISGLAAKSITKSGATALASGDIPSGAVVNIQYDGTQFQITNVGNLGTVTSVAMTVPVEFSLSGSPVTGSGTLAVSKANQNANLVYAGPTSGGASSPTFRSLVIGDLPSLSATSNVLGADVALNNTGSFFTGPTISQGSTGTWVAFGGVTLVDTGGTSIFTLKMHDGTNIKASAVTQTIAASDPITVFLAGIFASPPGNIRIDVQDNSRTTGKILFNQSGLSSDSFLYAFRIA